MLSFYHLLGKVFYGIASCDGQVAQAELAELKRIIRTEWTGLDHSTDAFGSDAAFQIEVVFEWLLENEPEPDEVFTALSAFKASHPEVFTDKVVHLIARTAHKIAEAFAGKNKSELIWISRLNGILEH